MAEALFLQTPSIMSKPKRGSWDRTSGGARRQSAGEATNVN